METTRKFYPIFIFLLSVSFALDSDHANFIAAFVILCYVVLKERTISFDIGDLLIFSGAFALEVFVLNGIDHGLYYALGSVIMYQLGKMMIRSGAGDTGSIKVYPVLIPSAVLFFKGLLNYSYLLNDDYVPGAKKWPDITGRLTLRTHHSYYIVLMAALAGYFVIVLLIGRKKRGLAGIAASALTFVMAIVASNRLVVLLCILTSAFLMILVIIDRKLYRKMIVKILGSVILASVLFAVIAFKFNLFGLYDMYMNSSWERGGGILNNIRIKLIRNSFAQMKDYPWGHNPLPAYKKKKSIVLAHNSWVDFGRQGGIVTIILMIGFTLSNIYSLFRGWAKSTDIGKYALIAGFVGLSLLHMAEPAAIRNYLWWSLEVYLGGLLRGMYDVTRDPQKKQAGRKCLISVAL